MTTHERTVRWFFGAAALWLVAGAALAFCAALQLLWPEWLGGSLTLSFGRLAPAAVNALVYGWASQAGLGAAFWLLGRLGRVELTSRVWLPVAGVFWNVGVLLGVGAILAGESRSILLLEFPGSAGFFLLAAYLCIGIWGFRLFQERTRNELFIASSYFLAAVLAFPWLYATGYALLVWWPVQGSAQGPIAAWFAGGMANLWLGALALGSLYYLMPRLVGRPLASYHLAPLACGLFIFLGPWSGLALLIGGPVPLWMSTAGALAGVLMLVPVTLVAVNLGGMLTAGSLPGGLAFRFTMVGAAAFVLAYAWGAFLALPGVSGIFRFTDLLLGQAGFALLGFVGFSLFGVIYYLAPGVPGRLAHWHFWLAAVGVGLLAAALFLGGLVQGIAQNDPGLKFSATVGYGAPFRFLAVLGLGSFLLGSLCHLVWMGRNLFRSQV